MKKAKKVKEVKVLLKLKPQTESEWLEVMNEKTGAEVMRTRIKACTDSNETIRISMMAADTSGLDELDRMTILAFHALVQLEDLQAKIDNSAKVAH